MRYRALYAYAWDLAERHPPEIAAEISALGLNTITLAGSYHAGKFLRPRGKSGKVFFPEDGTVYFRADPARYGAIKPIANSIVAEHDFFAELSVLKSVAVNAWMVLLHNTRLGEAHRNATVQNAFGDRYVHSLCPSNPQAREYAVALCKDVTDRYDVLGLSIEAPGFAPYVHGFHHEFALVKSNRWLDSNLGLCFCRHCVAGARKAGVDAESLQARVRVDVESYLAGDFDLPDDMAEAFWLADTRSDGALGAFLTWRGSIVTSLVGEIRATTRKDATLAVIPTVARPTGGAWYEGSDLATLADAAGTIEACLYESDPERVVADAWDAKRRLAGKGRIRGILRPAHPDLNSAGAVNAAVQGLRDLGITDIAFYNYGLLRPRSLRWIGEALAKVGD